MRDGGAQIPIFDAARDRLRERQPAEHKPTAPVAPDEALRRIVVPKSGAQPRGCAERRVLDQDDIRLALTDDIRDHLCQPAGDVVAEHRQLGTRRHQRRPRQELRRVVHDQQRGGQQIEQPEQPALTEQTQRRDQQAGGQDVMQDCIGQSDRRPTFTEPSAQQQQRDDRRAIDIEQDEETAPHLSRSGADGG